MNMCHIQSVLNKSTGITITIGRSVLGSPIGSPEFINHFVHKKFEVWVSQISMLSDIVSSHLQSAFFTLADGFSKSGLIYLVHVLESIIPFSHLRMPSDWNLSLQSLGGTSLTARFLPFRLGGLGLSNRCLNSPIQYNTSSPTSTPLVDSILANFNKPTIEIYHAESKLNSLRLFLTKIFHLRGFCQWSSERVTCESTENDGHCQSEGCIQQGLCCSLVWAQFTSTIYWHVCAEPLTVENSLKHTHTYTNLEM